MKNQLIPDFIIVDDDELNNLICKKSYSQHITACSHTGIYYTGRGAYLSEDSLSGSITRESGSLPRHKYVNHFRLGLSENF